jgi:hypothetical protein
MNRASLVLVLAFGTSSACALRHPPVFMDAVLEYPRPDAETCGVIDQETVQLAVTVRDELGTKFPHTPVYMAPEEAGSGPGASPIVLATRTDSSGNALLQLPSDKAFHGYTVTVALAGFMPEVRTLSLRAGCAGHLEMILRVASTAALEALKANSTK